MNFTKRRAQGPLRERTVSLWRTHESGERLILQSTAKVLRPNLAPALYHNRSAVMPAQIAAPTIAIGAAPPETLSAPATKRTGYEGTGSPALSSRTETKTTMTP